MNKARFFGVGCNIETPPPPPLLNLPFHPNDVGIATSDNAPNYIAIKVLAGIISDISYQQDVQIYSCSV